MRLFWFAPAMFFLGLLVRQGTLVQWLTTQGFSAIPAATETVLIPPSQTPIPTLPAAFTQPATALPLPTLQADATPVPSKTPSPEMALAHISFYWPPLGDINCDYECEHIANGDVWQKWVGRGVACPTIYPLGTVFVIMGNEWECVDRGEAIVVNRDGSIWLDLLLPTMPKGVAWGTIEPVEIRRIKPTAVPH